MRVLLTDCSFRKAFDAYNCLKRLGYDVILAAPEGTYRNRLVYGQTVHSLRVGSPGQFQKDLERICTLHATDDVVMIPVEEDTIGRVYELTRRTALLNLHYALPSREAFETARHKKGLSAFCRKNGIPAPREMDLSELRRHFRKVVAKPDLGSGASGLIFIDSESDLGRLERLPETYLIQEQIPCGQEIQGGFFLFDRGECVSYYGHRRLRTYPARGGVTVFSKIDSCMEIRNIGVDLLSRLNWHGLAMVEFLRDPSDGVYKVIEVNPRLWGSILLGEFAEAGFLENYVRISLGLKANRCVAKPKAFIRWLLPYDLLGYIRSGGRIPRFWALNTRDTCFIGWTYSSIRRSLLFIILGLLNGSTLRKLFRSVRQK